MHKGVTIPGDRIHLERNRMAAVLRQTATLSAGGLPESTLWEYWDGYLWLNYYRFIYRYEEYDDGTVAIEEDPVSWAMKIFPNPATDQMSILVRTGIDGYGNLHITDMYGQLVASLNVPLSTGDNLIHLNLDDLGMDAGQYMVVLRSGSKQFRQNSWYNEYWPRIFRGFFIAVLAYVVTYH